MLDAYASNIVTYIAYSLFSEAHALMAILSAPERLLGRSLQEQSN